MSLYNLWNGAAAGVLAHKFAGNDYVTVASAVAGVWSRPFLEYLMSNHQSPEVRAFADNWGVSALLGYVAYRDFGEGGLLACTALLACNYVLSVHTHQRHMMRR